MNEFTTLTVSRRVLRSSVLLATVVLAACESATGLTDGISLEASITPAVVVAGDSMVATLRLENMGGSTAELVAFGCLALPVVLKDGIEMDWDGTSPACGTESWPLTIPSGGERVFTFALHAWLKGVTGQYDVPPEPGAYRLRFDVTAGLPSGNALPDREVEFVVQ